MWRGGEEGGGGKAGHFLVGRRMGEGFLGRGAQKEGGEGNYRLALRLLELGREWPPQSGMETVPFLI